MLLGFVERLPYRCRNESSSGPANLPAAAADCRCPAPLKTEKPPMASEAFLISELFRQSMRDNPPAARLRRIPPSFGRNTLPGGARTRDPSNQGRFAQWHRRVRY